MECLASELEFWHFDKNLMVFKDGSLGAGFKLSGFDMTCATNEQINQMTQHLEDLMTVSQEGLKFQVLYKLSPNVDNLIEDHRKLSESIEGPYQRIAKARLAFYRKNQNEKKYFLPEIYFFIRSQSLGTKKQGLFSSSQYFASMLEKDFAQGKNKFMRSVHGVESLLVSAGLKPMPLNSEAWFQLIFEHLNFERKEKVGSPHYREPKALFDPSVSEQLTLTDFTWNKDAISMGGYQFRTISLATLPEGQTFAAMVNAFSTVPFHFWISQSIHLLNQRGEKASLELKRRIAYSMASGSQNVSDLDSENKLGQIEGLLSHLIEGSEKLVSSDFNVMIWAKSLEELGDKTDEILKTFRLLNQAEGLQETLTGKVAFLKSLPGCCEGLRHKKMKSSNAVHLMPVFANWRGNSSPVCLLPTRDGELFSLDPYAEHLPSWNGIVFGSSGSGKSYALVQLMAMFYGKVSHGPSGQAHRPRIVWIDNGASSKRLIEILDGEFVDFSLESDLCLNVFDLKEGETQPSSDRVRTILAVLEMILKDENQKTLGKREKALLEEQIYKVYKLHMDNGEEGSKEGSKKWPILSDFKSLLDGHNDPKMRGFGEILYSWTGSSAYGQMLDGPTNVKLSKDLISVEIRHLNSYPELKDVVLLILTSYIQDVASSDIEREYLLIIDEAERLLQSELARQVVITCYRTWRKFKSGIWCLSQNYKDFMMDDSLKDALMTNTTNVIILPQRKIDWNDFQKTFDFNDVQVERIKSLSICKGEYSELYYLQGDRDTILRLIPEPLSHWFSTSDANDKVRISHTEAKFPEMSQLDVLECLAFPKDQRK